MAGRAHPLGRNLCSTVLRQLRRTVTNLAIHLTVLCPNRLHDLQNHRLHETARQRDGTLRKTH